jgi:hypothetical protein
MLQKFVLRELLINVSHKKNNKKQNKGKKKTKQNKTNKQTKNNPPKNTQKHTIFLFKNKLNNY